MEIEKETKQNIGGGGEKPLLYNSFIYANDLSFVIEGMYL